MQVAAVAPQFIAEVPDFDANSEAERTANELAILRMVEEAHAASPSDQALDQETKEGLKRLSQLIKKAHEGPIVEEGASVIQASSPPPPPPPGAPSLGADFLKRRALQLYARVGEAKDPLTVYGQLFDRQF